ncbi:MAG: Gfo/Idh/MocA family oxidoreductase [Gemmatimonadota bacterium]
MSAPRVAIIGAGTMGRWHADAARHAGALVVAVADPRLELAQVIAGSGTAVASATEAVALGVDAVHICTPLDSHLRLCRLAFAAGCHIIVEKPVTPSREEAEALVREAREAGKLLVPVHQFVWQDGVQRILARREAIGPLRHIEFATCSAGADRIAGSDRDAIAAEIVPHAFSLARALLHRPVGELEWRLLRPVAGEWTFSATTPEGCTITGLISLSSRPTFATCRVLGEHGSARADLFQGFALFEPDTSSTSYKVMRPVAVGLGTMSMAAWHLVGRAVRWERAYPGLRTLCAATYAAIAGLREAPFRDDEIVDVATGRDRVMALVAGQSVR